MIGCVSKNILWKRDPVVSKIGVNGRVSAGHRKRRQSDPVDSRTRVLGRVSAFPGNISISSHNMHDELSNKA